MFDRITARLSRHLLDHFVFGNPSRIYRRVYQAVDHACWAHCMRHDLALWGKAPITYVAASNFVDPF